MSSIGELESEVLKTLNELGGKSTASEILAVLRKRRDVAYTTVSTTLDRLFKKKLVNRSQIPGRGGTQYIFSIGSNEKLKNRIVKSSLDRLTGAFGDTAYSALYGNIESMSRDDLERLKQQVDKALKSRGKGV